jgi:hypothetical protein
LAAISKCLRVRKRSKQITRIQNKKNNKTNKQT